MKKDLSYEEEQQLQKEYLDQIDMDKYLYEWADLDDIMKDVEDDAINLPPLPEEFDGYVFNFMDTYDFAQYLKEKGYCNDIVEETQYLVRRL